MHCQSNYKVLKQSVYHTRSLGKLWSSFSPQMRIWYVIDAASLIYGSKICNVINTLTNLYPTLFEEQNQLSFDN